MKQRTNQILFGYWNEVRRGRMAPARFDIEPSRISQILPETFILERVQSDRYLFRLAGTRVCELCGREFRGVNLLDTFESEPAATLERLLAVATGQGAVIVLALEAKTAKGRRTPLEMLLLPLVHTDASVSRFLCSIAEQETADWLGHEAIASLAITTHELIWPDGRPFTVLTKLHRPGAFAPLPRSTDTADAARRRFRVLDGGRDDPKDAGTAQATAPKSDGI